MKAFDVLAQLENNSKVVQAVSWRMMLVVISQNHHPAMVRLLNSGHVPELVEQVLDELVLVVMSLDAEDSDFEEVFVPQMDQLLVLELNALVLDQDGICRVIHELDQKIAGESLVPPYDTLAPIDQRAYGIIARYMWEEIRDLVVADLHPENTAPVPET